jgi:hypothetical protein
VSEREAAEAARKAERQSAADRIYDKMRLEKEAELRAQVRRERLRVCVVGAQGGSVLGSRAHASRVRLRRVNVLWQEEEQRLIDLMREEEQAEARRQAAAGAAAKREAAKQVCVCVCGGGGVCVGGGGGAGPRCHCAHA